MNECAYCGKAEKLTREHIVPSFIYEFQKDLENKVVGWNEAAGKMVGGESKIKDVCACCNNGILSDLDAYSKSLLVESGLLVQNYIKKNISLNYDYHLLVRWLLKVSFNSSRTDGVHSHLFEDYIPYILSGKNHPKKNQISVLAQMAAPEMITESGLGKEKFLSFSGGSHILNPFLIRICYGGLVGASGYTLRMIVLGPLVFYLMMFEKGVSAGHAATEIRRIIKNEKTAKLMKIQSKHIELKAGETTWLDLYAVQIKRSKMGH